MALWHILVRSIRGVWVPESEAWDDGHSCRPGDDAFSTTGIQEQANGKPFNYIGTPDWQPA